jgi:hypothetical protein
LDFCWLDNLRRTDANPLDYLAMGKESLVPNQPIDYITSWRFNVSK